MRRSALETRENTAGQNNGCRRTKLRTAQNFLRVSRNDLVGSEALLGDSRDPIDPQFFHRLRFFIEIGDHFVAHDRDYFLIGGLDRSLPRL